MNTDNTTQPTPRGNRLHIGIFGRTNSGKSSILNALTAQPCSVVSDIAGTTTDPVYKPMELHGIGPVVFIDTAGFGDTTPLGNQRMRKTECAAEQTDIALVVFSPEGYSQDGFEKESEWIQKINKLKKKFLPILNKVDLLTSENATIIRGAVEQIAQTKPVELNATNCININTKKTIQETSYTEVLRVAIARLVPEDYEAHTLTGKLCKEDSLVLLVMPQDIQAPKGRLILPQVQILRELLDKKCIVMSCTTDKLKLTLSQLSRDPDLIITDSQVFATVYEQKPKQTALTSFSILMAASKGDITGFIEGACAIQTLTQTSRVLIAEACTHAPLTEDIGREKLPRLLQSFAAKNGCRGQLAIDMVSGTDFPQDVSQYSLIIHCGACMFNRAYVLARQQAAATRHVPMTNYGVAIAYMAGILDQVVVP